MLSWPIKSGKRSAIGLDIGSRLVKMIQLSSDNGHVKVTAADKFEIGGEFDADCQQRSELVVSGIKRILDSGNFKGKDVVSCLSSDDIRLSNLRVSGVDKEKIEDTVRKEACERFSLDPEEDAVDYIFAGTVHQGEEVKNELVMFAADNAAIRSHIDLLERTGLNPVSLDAVPFALLRSFRRHLKREDDKEKTTIFIEVGSRFTTVVFSRAERMVFVKQIQLGGDDFNKLIAEKLGVSVEQASVLRRTYRSEVSLANGVLDRSDDLEFGQMYRSSLDISTRRLIVEAINVVAQKISREISLCFRYYAVTFRGKRVQRAVVAGGEAYGETLLKALKEHLDVAVEVAEPLKGFKLDDGFAGDDRRSYLCEWAVAAGLAQKGFVN